MYLDEKEWNRYLSVWFNHLKWAINNTSVIDAVFVCQIHISLSDFSESSWKLLSITMLKRGSVNCISYIDLRVCFFFLFQKVLKQVQPVDKQCALLWAQKHVGLASLICTNTVSGLPADMRPTCCRWKRIWPCGSQTYWVRYEKCNHWTAWEFHSLSVENENLQTLLCFKNKGS